MSTRSGVVPLRACVLEGLPMDGLYRVFSRIADGLMWLGCLALTLMMLHVTADVAGKYLLGRPIVGTLETVTHYYMVAAVFLPLGVVQKYRGQIIVDIATQHLPPRKLALVEGLVSLLTLIFLLLMVWYAGARAMEMTAVLEKVNAAHFPIDIWPTRWFVVAGAASCAVFVAMQIANDFAFAFSGRHLFPEDSERAAH